MAASFSFDITEFLDERGNISDDGPSVIKGRIGNRAGTGNSQLDGA
jgi:hypothetical protein